MLIGASMISCNDLLVEIAILDGIGIVTGEKQLAEKEPAVIDFIDPLQVFLRSLRGAAKLR